MYTTTSYENKPPININTAVIAFPSVFHESVFEPLLLKTPEIYEHGFTPALLFLSLGREEKNIVDPNEQ